MRYSMDTGEPIVSLARELDYVKAYFALQRQRVGNQIQYEVHVDERLLQLQVPKMILQPLVENYFKHGYDMQTETGAIAIYGEHRIESGMLRLEVRDNGKGMGEAELRALQDKLNQSKAVRVYGEFGIGLPNILSRLKLYYNETANLEVAYDKSLGFRVILWIPIAKKGESG
jgi:two-component system sensor histidine kinase YesM